MITDPFTEAARAEAEYRHPAFESPSTGRKLWPVSRDSFIAGAEWARTYLAAQEPTDPEVGHAYAEWMNHSPVIDRDARRLHCVCGERGFTPYGYEHHRLRAVLSAARAARRDEEDR